MADSPIMSPVSSQLSSHDSSEFGEDVKMEDVDDTVDELPDHFTHPSKKRRTGQYSHHSTPAPLVEQPLEDLGEISSDTSGSVPNSPSEERLRVPDEDPMSHEQITVCKWQDCPAGDLGNMDNLVQHLQDDHVAGKQTNYACEWHGCTRKGIAHASGYALKAHMRSHTKEKPFYCALPECDRSFTRSDALAKHMRTVHETDPLRPSDPVPRNYSSAHFKPQRLKLIVNAKPPNSETGDRDGIGAGAADALDDDATVYSPTEPDNEALPPSSLILPSNAPDNDSSIPSTTNPLHTSNATTNSSTSNSYPSDMQLTPEELSMAPDQLFKLLRRRLHWTEQENVTLRAECKTLETQRRDEWTRKELVLANLMEAELAVAHSNGKLSNETMESVLGDLPPEPLPMTGKEEPWFRQPP